MMNTKSLSAVRSLTVGIVLVCAPFTQACSENNQQSAEELGAAKLKQAQAQAAADKLAAEKVEKDRLEAERLKAQKIAEAKAEEARKAVEDAKAAQKVAGVAEASKEVTKPEPVKVADASDAKKPAAAVTAAAADGPPEFTEAFMSDAANITAGGELWKQCRHCHGAKAYPGKAPKLKPRKYKPSFVYNRITKGFRKMPPWKDVFSQEQRMQLVAFIKSKQFSP